MTKVAAGQINTINTVDALIGSITALGMASGRDQIEDPLRRDVSVTCGEACDCAFHK